MLNNAIDVDDAVNSFTRTLKHSFDLYVPTPRPRPSPPWSNNRLRKLKRLRAKTLRTYSNRRNHISQREFSLASSRYKSCNRFLYSKYVSRMQFELTNNPKRFWSFVNGKRKENGFPPCMFLANESFSTPDEICNLFANHFSSVIHAATVDSQQIDNCLRDVPADVINMNTASFSDEDVLAALGKLKSSNSVGPDGIPSAVLKKCASALCCPLRLIFNQSLSQSVFPAEWKKSWMCPVFKKGDKRQHCTERRTLPRYYVTVCWFKTIGDFSRRPVVQRN